MFNNNQPKWETLKQVNTSIRSSTELSELWTTKCQVASQQAKQLSEDLKTNREKKLSFRLKRYEPPNDHIPDPKPGQYEPRQDEEDKGTKEDTKQETESHKKEKNTNYRRNR